MALDRLTTIFQVTTAPPDLTRAIPHTGGWSESLWVSDSENYAAAIQTVRQRRAVLLPRQAKIIGFRTAKYELVANGLRPLGAASGALNMPGNTAYATDLPQVSLEIDWTAVIGLNTSGQMLRCIPDNMMSFGEYQPTSAFAGQVTAYISAVKANNIFIFPGRDLTMPRARVMRIVAGVIHVDAIPFGLVQGAVVRLLRVTSDSGNPLGGTYVVSAPIVGNTITVTPAPDGDVSRPSGYLRQDRITTFNIQDGTVKRARVKKIGRPSEGYRGRRSKARA